MWREMDVWKNQEGSAENPEVRVASQLRQQTSLI
jgi:hypothetical protein